MTETESSLLDNDVVNKEGHEVSIFSQEKIEYRNYFQQTHAPEIVQ